MFLFTDCKIGYEFNGTDCVSYFPNWWIIILCIAVFGALILILAYIVAKYGIPSGSPAEPEQLLDSVMSQGEAQ